ncbi:tetratricopeptide repeat protein [Rubinisphaera margarita]|uniref:tetratricopeptide repeat protein n=1 Tax=Rubinisphaera margarita TaxID=2909586 RepID=UPI001EE970DA|nr:hypothetical protein [Rubinisphaera margarita]MCG6155791.1 hypothetical protein [Rubinisphaera margarita]
MRRNEEADSTTTDDRLPEPRWLWPALWLIALLLLLSRIVNPGDEVRLFDSRESTLWGGTGWQVPLGRFMLLDPFLEVPYVVFAIIGATLVTGLARLQRHLFPMPALLVGTAALALGMKPEFTLAAAIVLAANGLIQRTKSPGKRSALVVGGLLAAIFCTREFGLVIAGLLIGPGVDLLRALKPKLSMIAGAAVCLILGGLAFVPGFIETGLRFLTAGLTPHAEMLIPSARSIVAGTGPTLAEWLLLGLLILGLLHAARSSDRLLQSFALVPVALFCTHYLWLVAFILSASFRLPTLAVGTRRVNQIAVAAGLVLAGFHASPQIPAVVGFVLGDRSEHRLDVAAWQSSGHVLLMNLNDASDWQRSRLRKRYDLVLDDRWEQGRQRFEDYAVLCRDLNEGRAGSYLRTDLGWGGYAAPLDQIEPTLLVQSSGNLVEIRRLSLSPHWRILGIDAERTYFGYTDDRTIQPQGRRAIELLNQLEWPRGKANELPRNTIVADSWDESLRVSAVICAIRFPYAAMRYLADDDSIETLKQRSWCWVEIAHRVRRHTGRTSLLDQSRAIAGFRNALRSGACTADERLDMAVSLHVLEADGPAVEFANSSLGDGSFSHPERTDDAEALIRKAKADSERLADRMALSDPEQVLRIHLKNGDRERATELLSQLPADRQPFYSFLIGVPDRSAVELYHELSGLLGANTIPADLADEAWFYQGCLGLEAGDTFAAVTAFQASREVAPNSPFAPLREMYLLRLGR